MKDDTAYLQHIRDAIQRVRLYTRDGRDAFMASTLIQDGVIRNLEITGEAVKRLSEATTSRRPEIPWKDIAGMRDVLIHNYLGVKLDTVWRVVERDLAPLAAAIDALLTLAEQDQQSQ